MVCKCVELCHPRTHIVGASIEKIFPQSICSLETKERPRASVSSVSSVWQGSRCPIPPGSSCYGLVIAVQVEFLGRKGCLRTGQDLLTHYTSAGGVIQYGLMNLMAEFSLKCGKIGLYPPRTTCLLLFGSFWHVRLAVDREVVRETLRYVDEADL